MHLSIITFSAGIILTTQRYDLGLFDIGIPLLGICYGMQLMNFISGGKIEKKDNREDGQHTIIVDSTSKLFAGINITMFIQVD